MPARDVLAVNLESMNFLVHPAIALLNIGAFDRAEARGRTIDFYGDGNVSVCPGRLLGSRLPLLREFEDVEA